MKKVRIQNGQQIVHQDLNALNDWAHETTNLAVQSLISFGPAVIRGFGVQPYYGLRVKVLPGMALQPEGNPAVSAGAIIHLRSPIVALLPRPRGTQTRYYLIQVTYRDSYSDRETRLFKDQDGNAFSQRTYTRLMPFPHIRVTANDDPRPDPLPGFVPLAEVRVNPGQRTIYAQHITDRRPQLLEPEELRGLNLTRAIEEVHNGLSAVKSSVLDHFDQFNELGTIVRGGRLDYLAYDRLLVRPFVAFWQGRAVRQDDDITINIPADAPDGVIPDAWHYAYLLLDQTRGVPPQVIVSRRRPTASGHHPREANRLFLGSFKLNDRGNIIPFARWGDTITFRRPVELVGGPYPRGGIPSIEVDTGIPPTSRRAIIDAELNLPTVDETSSLPYPGTLTIFSPDMPFSGANELHLSLSTTKSQNSSTMMQGLVTTDFRQRIAYSVNVPSDMAGHVKIILRGYVEDTENPLA